MHRFPLVQVTGKFVDIRDIMFPRGEEVERLNFIRSLEKYRLRRYHRQGMRSHIFEVLTNMDILKETKGEVVDGVLLYPRAVAQYMLRILRMRFANLNMALDEIKKYILILEGLGPELIAISNEFIVDYTGVERSEIVLCGLQEYVAGEIFDPWSLSGAASGDAFYPSNFGGDDTDGDRSANFLESIETFASRTRKMIDELNRVPDLAGNGNLIVSSTGRIKLVDINNINKVSQDDTIHLDDKDYPSCDKSIEVLNILEGRILQKENLSKDPMYSHFLTVERKKRVSRVERKFFASLPSSLYPE